MSSCTSITLKRPQRNITGAQGKVQTLLELLVQTGNFMMTTANNLCVCVCVCARMQAQALGEGRAARRRALFLLPAGSCNWKIPGVLKNSQKF